MGELSPWHWAIVAVVVMLLFGYKKLPDASRAIGRSLRIFKSEVDELHTSNKATPTTTPSVAQATPPINQVPPPSATPAAAPVSAPIAPPLGRPHEL